uniref:G-protein coupled receptors family 1 profile domain-containing protein n=1 Tax=Plectus sambesii TaxID=2011161 RepID=A0A914XLJ9_9BILA
MVMLLSVLLCFFPLQLLFGIFGNSLNLLVLLSKHMRSRTNSLLAATAIADMLFLLAMTPHYMARFPGFNQKQTDGCPKKQLTEGCVTLFHRFYVDYKMNLTFLANWFSAASCWLIVTVSFERLLAIKMPLHARNSACSRRMCALLAVIFGLTAALTFHHNVAFRVERLPWAIDEDSNDTLFRHQLIPQQREYVQSATIANILFVIVCPLALLIIVNFFLIYYLRRRHQFLKMGGARAASIQRTRDRCTSESSDSSRSRALGSGRERMGAATTPLAGERRSNASQWSRQMTSSQRKVTFMVAVIVTSYVISHAPSAVLVVFMYFQANHPITELTFYLTLLSNSLVITGKVANFFLFCTSSAHFRSRLRNIVCGITSKHRHRILSQTKLMSIPIVDRANTPLPAPGSWHDDHLAMDTKV